MLQNDRDIERTVTEHLSKILHANFELYILTQNYHWNVQGEHFYSHHKFLNDIYDTLYSYHDGIAEVIRTFDVNAFLDTSKIPSSPLDTNSIESMYNDILYKLNSLIRLITNTVKLCSSTNEYVGCINFLSNVAQDYEKLRWMIRSTALTVVR